jgi:hypothetical protein
MVWPNLDFLSVFVIAVYDQYWKAERWVLIENVATGVIRVDVKVCAFLERDGHLLQVFALLL